MQVVMQSNRTSLLFADFQNLGRIWTHPRVLRYNSDRYEIAAQKKVCNCIYICEIYKYN